MRKYVFLTVLMAVFLGGVQPQPVQAGILEFFFPSLKNLRPDPSRTLEAPFKERPVRVNEDEEKGPSLDIKQEDGLGFDSDDVLSLPHRTSGEISKWIEGVVSEALTFEGVNFQDDLNGTKLYFSEDGRSQYIAYLKDINAISRAQKEELQIRSVIMQAPILLNEGDVKGRYRWLYQVDVKSSFLKRGLKSYKNVQAENHDGTLLLQVGRFEDATDDLGVRVESWKKK